MKHFVCIAFIIVLSVGGLFLTGCGGELGALIGAIRSGIAQSLPNHSIPKPWNKNTRIQAEFFFNDPQVIALCKAIEKEDLNEIDRLIAAGADVNVKGKGNWTPLLWAFPNNNLEVFTKILEAGADPNVQLTSDFERAGELYLMFFTKKTEYYIVEGSSVMEMATMTYFPGYFEAVMKHGGNPNLVSKEWFGNTPLHSVVYGSRSHNRIEHAKLLLDAGADINAVARGGTPIMVAVQYRQFDLAIFLLETGADWEIVPQFDPKFPPGTLVWSVYQATHHPYIVGTQNESLNKLVLLLTEKGADFDKEREYEEERERKKFREIHGQERGY